MIGYRVGRRRTGDDAYDFAGEQLWQRNLQTDHGKYTIWYGHANSPVLYQQSVISVCMQDSLADLQDQPVESYLVAHDLKTGRERWKVPRKTRATAEQCDSYTTPLLAKINERQQLIVMGGTQLDGYDPATGKQLWFLPNLTGGRLATGLTLADDLIIATRGLRGPLFGVKVTGEGELPRKSIAWEHADATPDSCSPVAWGEYLFTVTDDGIARCLHAESGNTKWKHRIPGNYKASPVAVEGRVYFLNTNGLCTVLSAAPYYDKLTENQLDDELLASPAIAGGTLILRGKKFLYGIEK
jgi:outer membrane protein assembly factor BamB